ncbi:MAG: TatD family hydrolase [Bacteroidales bacterium]|nr:TatD family hydrolase [Lentimicrobiaceae bacterium]MDD5693966.1 TatD family hydrolase [Bacteroidales bacterium]
MTFTDTHTHLYLDAFDHDRDQVIQSALEKHVEVMLLPNIDRSSIDSMQQLCSRYPGICLPMMGLHPTSVNGTYEEELQMIDKCLEHPSYVAVGEIGMDLYWDHTYQREQELVFRHQISLALEKHLPVVIHSRNAIDRIIEILQDYRDSGLTGVFHCFSGSLYQARQIIEMGFYLGIGGVLTFQKSGLAHVVSQVDLEHILLETDSPFLAPVPYRGKRNESAYLPLVAEKLAEIRGTTTADVAGITTANARKLFALERNVVH